MQEHILQFFAYEHLPEHLQAVSKPFGELAQRIVETTPRNPERTVALRKLLESKDAVVRARTLNELARRYIARVVRQSGNLSEAARRIGLHRRSLQRKLDKLRIARDGCLL